MDTAFNAERFELFNQFVWKVDVINMTEGNINETFQNITMALIQLHSFWNTTTNTTRSTSQNIFVFSPDPLIVPYVSYLTVVIAFLFLGYSSLGLNGVSALTGGFSQTLVTMTGSESLREAAAAGCFGGQRNNRQKLKDMEIMYGELIDQKSQENDVRRATFGLKGEINQLRKEGLFGR